MEPGPAVAVAYKPVSEPRTSSPGERAASVRHLFRAVAEGIGPGGFLDILVVNVRVRMIKTNGAFEPKLHATVGGNKIVSDNCAAAFATNGKSLLLTIC